MLLTSIVLGGLLIGFLSAHFLPEPVSYQVALSVGMIWGMISFAAFAK